MAEDKPKIPGLAPREMEMRSRPLRSAARDLDRSTPRWHRRSKGCDLAYMASMGESKRKRERRWEVIHCIGAGRSNRPQGRHQAISNLDRRPPAAIADPARVAQRGSLLRLRRIQERDEAVAKASGVSCTRRRCN
jgi:hypothetical protein